MKAASLALLLCLSPFLMANAATAPAPVPVRAYKEGEKITYEITIERRHNGQLQLRERAVTEHKVVRLPDGKFGEEIRWKEASRSFVGGKSMNLAADIARLSGRHLHSLAPAVQAELPGNVSGDLVNLFTELNRAYFAIQGAAGHPALRKKGDHAKEGRDLFGNWSQGGNIGLDCFQREFELGGKDKKGNLTLLVRYVAPEKPCSEFRFEAPALATQVVKDRPNNYGTVDREPDGRWQAVWGNEEFAMKYELSPAGRLELATTQNVYRLRRRFGCNEKLEECTKGPDGKIESDFLMERKIRVRVLPSSPSP